MKKIFEYPAKFIRACYDWTINWAKTKYASWALFLIAFAESSFFPVPPDVLLIPMAIAERQKWFQIALICSVGSVLGALLGYFIGYQFYELIGQKIVDLYNLQPAVDAVTQQYHQHAFIAIFTAAFTPIPFKVFTIVAGLCKISITTLIIASAIGRSARFFIVAFLIRIFGEKIQYFIEKYFNLLTIIFVILLIGGFFCIKFLKQS
ncbi:YqaA family protein [Candidatus Ruminimicrobium bovinum]|uniref:YqaA family protein n=1 Tax=Candidatus Ruminimicrobium bovinum TaxID=3242779 RepID=UPI0039B97705